MIECRALSRSFDVDGDDPKVALDDVDFSVERGETRCLLGPNGAGKTTLVRILATVLLPTSGSASVGGFDVVEQADNVRRTIRLSLGGDRGFHFGLSVFENVRFWATMYGLGWREATRETNRVLDVVGLGAEKKVKADGLSRGMKQRVHLARTLLGDAELLLLDEPTTGIDPVAARSFPRVEVFDLGLSGGQLAGLIGLVMLCPVVMIGTGLMLGSLATRVPWASNVLSGLARGILGLLCGATFAGSFLPGWLQVVSQTIPLTHIVAAARDVSAGDPAGANLLLAAASGAVWVALSHVVINNQFQRSRATGVFA